MTTVQQQRRHKRKLLTKIGRRSAAGASEIGRALLEREKSRFLTSWDVQSVTLYDIWCRDHRAPQAQEWWSASQERPRIVRDYRRTPSTPISWYPRVRNTLGFRKICNLPATLKMWHVLAKELIVAQHHPRPHIGDWFERGRNHQIAEIARAIRSERSVAVVADVVRAFPSVSLDAVYSLPYLPEALIRRAIDYRSLRFAGGYRSASLWDVPSGLQNDLEMAPSGLLEGSPVSNAIFSVLLDDLPDHIDEDILPFVYCDNVILLAPDELRARIAAKSLVRYLTDHRAGPFEVRLEIRSARDGIDHLGYSIYRRDTDIEIDLAPSSYKKLVARLEDREVKCSDTLRWLHASYPALSRQRMANWVQVVLEEDQQRQRQRSSSAAQST